MTIRRIERQATQEELVENERRKKAFEAELLVERRVNINLKNKWRESGLEFLLLNIKLMRWIGLVKRLSSIQNALSHLRITR